MITFSNGHKLDFACASGALAFNGLGWPWEQPFRWARLLRPNDMTIVAKTVTIKPCKGNLSLLTPWRSVNLIRGGAVNAIGLTNPGIDHWIKNDYPVIKKHGFKAAVSIQADYPDADSKARRMATKLQNLDLAYIELNISCPNVPEDSDVYEMVRSMLEQLSEEAKHPIVVKISYGQSQDKKLMQMIDGYDCVEAIHAINTIPWSTIYPKRISPLEKYYGLKGGISGKMIFPLTVKAVKAVTTLNDLSTPIIAGGGINSLDDVQTVEEAGAKAFSIGTLFIRQPWKPNLIISKYRKRHE